MKVNKNKMKNQIMKFIKSKKRKYKRLISTKNYYILKEVIINKYLKQKNAYKTKNQVKK